MPFLGKVPSQIVDSDVDIDGGTIDGATIGSITAGAGTFTNLSATGTITFPDDGISGDDINGGTISNVAISGTTASFSGDLSVDGNTLFVDASDNKVGIGTASPQNILHIVESGTPIGATVGLVVQRNGASFNGSQITIVGGTGGSSALNFGDSDDVDIGRITYDHATNHLGFITNTSEAMRIDSSGNVGIGTVSPQFLLHASGSGSQAIGIERTGASSSALLLNAAGSEAQLYARESASVDGSVPMTFWAGGLERLRIDASGNVGIGTSSPSGLLKTLNIDGGSQGSSIALDGGSNFSVIYTGATAGDPTSLFSNTGFKFATATDKNATGFAEAMRIDSSGNVGIGTNVFSNAAQVLVAKGDSSVSTSDANASGFNFTAVPDTTTGKVGIGFKTHNETAAAVAALYATPISQYRNALTARYNADINGGYFSIEQLVPQTSTVIERLHINAGGNVGIGTANPTTKLHILDTNPVLTIQSSGASTVNTFSMIGRALDLSAQFNTIKQVSTAGGQFGTLAFCNGPSDTERMRINSSGHLCIGTTGMTQGGSGPLQVYSSGGSQLILGKATGAPSISFGSTTTAYGLIEGINGGGFTFYTGNGTLVNRLAIDASGYLISQTTYNATTGSAANMHVLSSGVFLRSVSSIKYKTGVEDAWLDYAKKLYDLRPVYYKSLGEFDNPDWSYWGFIAEEVAEVDPRLAHFKTTETSFDENGERVETQLAEPEVEGVQYDRMVPLLLMLMKEQKEQIETLQAEVAALKGA